MSNLELMKANLILDRFTQADLRPSTLVLTLRDEKKNHLSSLGKATALSKTMWPTHCIFFLRKESTRNVVNLKKLFLAHLINKYISSVFRGVQKKIYKVQKHCRLY